MQLRIKSASKYDNWEHIIPIPYDPSFICDLMLKYTKQFPASNIYLTQYGIQLAYAKWLPHHGAHDIVVCIDPRRVTEHLEATLGRMPEKRRNEALAMEPPEFAGLFVELPQTH